MPLAVITLAFDPTFRAGPVAVRWETLGLAVAFAAALLVAAMAARISGRRAGLSRLRQDDLLYLVLASVPGAVLGGRLLTGLTYIDYYRGHLAALADPAQGTLSLLGAVLGGTISAAYMARLLGVPTRRWLDALAVPLLVAISLGRVAYLLGGGGQGAAHQGVASLAFAGPGPWLSPGALVPAYPSQLLEAAWAALGIPLLLLLATARVQRRLPLRLRQEGAWLAARWARGAEVDPERLRFGYLYLASLGWWLVGRVLVAFTWRDPAALGVLNADQLESIAALVAVGLLAAWWARAGRAPAAARG